MRLPVRAVLLAPCMKGCGMEHTEAGRSRCAGPPKLPIAHRMAHECPECGDVRMARFRCFACAVDSVSVPF